MSLKQASDRTGILIAGAVLGLVLMLSAAAADRASAAAPPQPQPTGEVILTVTGAAHGRAAAVAWSFDRPMLEALGIVEVRTRTTWTDGVGVFRGVLVSALLDHVGVRGEMAHAVALNDYEVKIPTQDFYRYPVVLAFEMNGETLTPRDKGPLWIVYPRDDYKELDGLDTDRKMIWQLVELQIR